MKLSLAFDACALLVVLVLCGAVATAEQPADPEADRVREMHKDLAGTRVPPLPESSLSISEKPITFKVAPNTAVMKLMDAKRCTGGKANDVFFTVYDGHGQPIVSINECTGAVTVSHPERMDEQARAFWRTVQTAWPTVCAPPRGNGK